MSFHGFLDFLFNDELTFNSLPKNMQEKIFSNFMNQQKGFYLRYSEELKNTNISKTVKTLKPFFRRQLDEQLRVVKRLTDIMNRGISRRNMDEDFPKFQQAIRQHIALVFYLDRKSINGRRNIRLKESVYKRHEPRIVEYFFKLLAKMLKENKFKNLTKLFTNAYITESPVRSPSLDAIFRIVTALAYDLAFSLRNTLKKYKPYVDRVLSYIVYMHPFNVRYSILEPANSNNNNPANVPAMRNVSAMRNVPETRNSLQNVNKWVRNTYRNFQPELNTLRRSAFNTEYQIAKK